MPAPPASAYEAAQRALAVVAAQARGDYPAAEQLLGTFDDDACKASAFFLASQIAVRMLADALDQDVDTCASDLAVALAAAAINPD